MLCCEDNTQDRNSNGTGFAEYLRGTSNQIEKEILILSRIGWIYSGSGYSALTHFCEEYLQH